MALRTNPMTRLAILLGGQPWLPRFAKQIVGLDMWLRRLTRGRITLLTFAGLPELFLTVPGRKSGIARTTPLLCVPYDDGWLIAGTNWGGPKAPAWVVNVAAVEAAGGTGDVEFRGRRYQVVPTEQQGADRERAWQAMLALWPNYAKYQARAERPIRVFHLVPPRK